MSHPHATANNPGQTHISELIPRYRREGLAIGLVLVFILSVASLVLGTRAIALSSVADAIFAYNSEITDHLVVRQYRLPRTLLAILCGAAFGVAGALIQAATRNPLADPGIMGVNAGAAFCVVLAVGLLGWQSVDAYVWSALAGAIVVTLLAYAIGVRGRDGADPARLVLAGVALSALLGGTGSAITLLNPQAFETLRQWSVGSVSGRDISVVVTIVPFISLGLLFGLLAARQLNTLALGEDLARALGGNILRTRILVILAVTLLSGAATAAVGPVGFIGLMVPHAVRWFTGPDQRWIIALAIVFSPALLLAADIVGRLVLYPAEIEAGIVTAFLGAPVLVLLARGRRMSDI